MSDQFEASNSADGPRTLVVLLHGYRGSAASLQSVLERTRRAFPHMDPQSDVYCPDMPLGVFSTADPDAIVSELLAEIDRRWLAAISECRPIQRIVLVGHSIGALLARKLYVVACGEALLAPLESAYKAAGDDGLLLVRPWAFSVERIVLLAGMNRGWRLTHYMGLLNAAVWALGTFFAQAYWLVFRKQLLIMAFRKGASFLTQLRIQWLRMRYRAKADHSWPGQALTVQLLGSRDDVVGPEDNVDLASGGDFLYLDVANSGHADIVDMAHSLQGQGRGEAFRLALGGTQAAIMQEAVLPADDGLPSPDPNVSRVVFVIHGIRDVGYWTHKVARHIRRQATKAQVTTWATETSSYGYFPMLPFLLPWSRRTKVEWFMDQYAEAVARYPLATFSFVGHSNGTYLLAKALEIYPCCRFDRVVFAGSVVRRSFDWDSFFVSRPCDRPPQVGSVLNLVATHDWVVAWFPKLFQWLGIQDLGSAGHDGFQVAENHPRVAQVVAIRGGHGAGVEEQVWSTIAQYVITGRHGSTQLQTMMGKRSWLVALLGRFPLLVWGLIFLLLGAAWWLIAMGLGNSIAEPWMEGFATGIALMLFLGCIWLVSTRI